MCNLEYLGEPILPYIKVSRQNESRFCISVNVFSFYQFSIIDLPKILLKLKQKSNASKYLLRIGLQGGNASTSIYALNTSHDVIRGYLILRLQLFLFLIIVTVYCVLAFLKVILLYYCFNALYSGTTLQISIYIYLLLILTFWVMFISV